MLCSNIQGSSVLTLGLNSAAQAVARLLSADTEYPTFTALIDADIAPLQIRLKSMRFPASPLALGCTALPTCAAAVTHADLTFYCSWMEPSTLHSSTRYGVLECLLLGISARVKGCICYSLHCVEVRVNSAACAAALRCLPHSLPVLCSTKPA